MTIRKAYREHTNPSAFHWNSMLSQERKEEICAWVRQLSEEDARALEDLLDDVKEAAIFDCENHDGCI